MCGICGFNWEDRALLCRMMSEMSHRGPDAKGKFLDKGISLGNVRLSIIDLSKKGDQPIFNRDKSMLIVYNGELYNYKTLKAELIGKGHSFDSETDTEVVLHAYEEYGLNCLLKFRGVFAFCIYDLSHKKLFLARDHLGVKPLYYYNTDEEFIFASEIKSILKYQKIKPFLNFKVLPDYFSFRYVPGPHTMFDKISKLLPGYYMIYDLKKKSITIRQYWNIQSAHKTRVDSYEDLVKQLNEQLSDSVSTQMVSDVPYGLFLSGGLDSSSILAFMKQANPAKRISTFSLGFQDSGGYENELRYAKLVSEHFGTDHHEVMISPDSLKILPKLVFYMDEPVSDATTIPTYFLSEIAGKKVKFVLAGEGGDELFGGYAHYRIINRLDRFRKFLLFRGLASKIIKKVPSGMLTKMLDYPSVIGSEGRQRLSELVTDSNDRTKTYLDLVSVFSERDKEELISKNLYGKMNGHFFLDLKRKYFSSGENIMVQVRLREMQTWLPDYILTRLDKMGMACSLESRVPLLDIKLVNWVNSLPCEYRQDKRLLKSAVRQNLPKRILNRKKYPFTAPIDFWYRKGYKEMAEHILEGNKEVYQFINKTYVNRLLNKKGDSNMIHSRQLWSLLTFAVWYEIFIKKTNLNSSYWRL